MALFACMGFLAVSVAGPLTSASSYASPQAEGAAAPDMGPAQVYTAEGDVEIVVDRDEYGVTKPKPKPKPAPAAAAAIGAPAAGTPDPGSAQAIAQQLVAERGWGGGEFNCLVSLWNKESGWNVYAHNTSSGAYGIPQSLPGNKMASVGADWASNPRTQIIWGLGYIQGRYGSPCGAWAKSQASGWY